MPSNTDAKPLIYRKENQPQFEDDALKTTISPFNVYNEDQLEGIERSLKQANYLLPQVADTAPSTLIRGLVRYAVDPWHPLGSTAGDDGWVYYDGSAWVDLLTGLFTSAAAGIVPASGGGTANFLRADGTWAAPPDNDKTYATLIDTKSPSGSSAATFTSIPSTYDDLLIEIIGLSHGDGTSRTLQLAASEDNFTGTKNITGSVRGSGTVTTSATSPMSISGTTIASSGIVYGSILIKQYTNTSASYLNGQITRSDTAFFDDFAGFIAKAAALNALRFTWSGSVNFDAGSVKLYGLKKA